jgi:thioesterase domain-containing protein
LSIRSLFEAPSVERLAERLLERRPAESDFEALLPIRRSGKMPPLFCIHHAGGFSWPYSRLIRHIPSGHPIYGLQAINLTQRDLLPHSVEAMAADYLSLIRQVQPEGPYNLLGWSFGGLVAHAIATDLQSNGEEVALLALLDSYPRDRENTRHSFERPRESGVLFAGVADNSIRTMLDTLRREGHVLSTLTEDHYAAIMDVFENNVRLMTAFSPKRFHGDVSLFVATEGEPKPPNDIWEAYVDGHIKVHPVDCAHDNMMDALPAAKIGGVLATELAKQRTIPEFGINGGDRDESI